MFEIPDEDENFWEDLPLDEITNSNALDGNEVVQKRQLRECQTSSKKRCIEGQTGVIVDCRVLEQKVDREKSPVALQTRTQQLRGNVFVPDTQEDSNFKVTDHNPADLTRKSPVLSESPVARVPSEQAVRKRKRKFPGPAGLLPKLAQGQTLSTIPDKVTECPDKVIQKEDVILSSQSAEDIFSDSPWQMLLQDLGDGGRGFLDKFSIHNSLQMARKKQLPKGKIPLLMGVIETVDWPGVDASVCLKDKSGKIHGTVHQNVMKEYEGQLQPSSAVILRQISVISPTTRNHYVNITPSNIVSIYCNKGVGRHRLANMDTPLLSVLKNLEQDHREEMLQLQQRTPFQNVTTPLRNPSNVSNRTPMGQNRAQPMRANFEVSTPSNQQYGANSSMSNTHYTPESRNVYNRTPVSQNRDQLRPNFEASTPTNRTVTNSSYSTGARFTSGNTPALSSNQQLSNNCQSTPRFRFKSQNSSTPAKPGSFDTPNRTLNSFNTMQSQTPAANISKSGAIITEVSNAAHNNSLNNSRVAENRNISTMNTSSVIGVKSTVHSDMNNTSSTSSPHSNETPGTSRLKQLCNSLTNDTPKSKWTFKSRKTSPEISTSNQGNTETMSKAVSSSALSCLGNVMSSVTDPKKITPPCLEVESLWQDDLSDDLLSQLSEEM